MEKITPEDEDFPGRLLHQVSSLPAVVRILIVNAVIPK
jgi:hypothetical protein